MSIETRKMRGGDRTRRGWGPTTHLTPGRDSLQGWRFFRSQERSEGLQAPRPPTHCVRMEDLQSQGPTGGLERGRGAGRGWDVETRELQRRTGHHWGPEQRQAKRRLAGGGDTNPCCFTHLPDVRPAARSTDASQALPHLRDTAFATAGAPEPESREWYRSGQSGLQTWAQGGVHRGHWWPGKATPCTACSTASNNASREQHRTKLSPLFPGLRSQLPLAAAGFPAATLRPSLLGLRHLVGGGKNTVRLRVGRQPAFRRPEKRGLCCAAALAAALPSCGPCSPSCGLQDFYLGGWSSESADLVSFSWTVLQPNQ